MKAITLQFQTPQDFKGFRQFVESDIIESSIQNLTITCNCNMKQIAEAITQFGAMIINSK